MKVFLGLFDSIRSFIQTPCRSRRSDASRGRFAPTSSLAFSFSFATAVLFFGVANAHAQTDFGRHAVGSPTTLTVHVRSSSGGAVSQVRILTTGNADLDYMPGA